MVHFSKLFYIGAAIVPALAYDGISGVPTYDAEIKANASHRLSLINHKACETPHNGAGCTTTSANDITTPVPLDNVYGFMDENYYVDLYSNPFQYINWTHANPDYPIYVMLLFDESRYNLTAELPGHATGLFFNFVEPTDSMNFSAAFSSERGIAKLQLAQLLTRHELCQWRIGQPDDPQWKGDDQSQNGLILDTSTQFVQLINSAFGVNTDSIVDAIRKRSADKLDAERHKWKLGVGIGVGLGVPAIAALSYFCGRYAGRKKSPKAVKSGSDSM